MIRKLCTWINTSTALDRGEFEVSFSRFTFLLFILLLLMRRESEGGGIQLDEAKKDCRAGERSDGAGGSGEQSESKRFDKIECHPTVR